MVRSGIFSKVRALFVVFALLCTTGILFAQTQPAQQGPPVKFDPTHPETQPNLTLDHDPVISPDAADNTPTGPTMAAGPTTKGSLIQQGKNGVYTLQENVNEVLLPCTVVDEKGNLVTDLTQSDFRVWEDGVQQTIASFQHQDMPVSMGILVDNSGSMLDKHQAVDQAALTLVRNSNPQDTAFIVNFNQRAYLDQTPTSNIHLLEAGLDHFNAGGETAIYDAVAASADELAHHSTQPKQVLLIITDGADNASRLTLQQVVRRVQNLGGPVVYTIGLLFGDDPDEARQARSALQTLSDETGGLAYFPASLDDVQQIAQEVARVIRNQYTVGYHSTKPANLGGYRTVRVEAYSRKYGKLVVRTRRGYYPKEMQQKQSNSRASRAE